MHFSVDNANNLRHAFARILQYRCVLASFACGLVVFLGSGASEASIISPVIPEFTLDVSHSAGAGAAQEHKEQRHAPTEKPKRCEHPAFSPCGGPFSSSSTSSSGAVNGIVAASMILDSDPVQLPDPLLVKGRFSEVRLSLPMPPVSSLLRPPQFLTHH